MLQGRGEMIPNESSYCEIDPHAGDRNGIPVLRFHFQWTDNEIKQARHMRETFQQILETMGGRVLGLANPECESEDDPRISALNRYRQAHEVNNLFAADAAPFASNPDENPTLTIVAMAWRTAEYRLNR